MGEQEPIGKAHRGLADRRHGAEDAPASAGSPRRATSRTQDIDRYVGARIRERRIMLGLTQQQLAHRMGVTFQQEHKYERALNRISAGRLFELAEVLHVPVSYFYEGAGEPVRQLCGRERLLLETVRTFSQITSPGVQEALCVLARSLAAEAV